MLIQRRLATIMAMLCAALASGCAGTLSPQAARQLESCRQLYHSGDDEAASQCLTSFLQDKANKSAFDQAHYLRGLSRLRAGERAGAKADFNAALRYASDGDLEPRALLELGQMAYEADDMARAENTLRQALANISEGEQPGDRARYLLGCVLQRQGRWEDADLQFDRVVFQFEGSDIARQAGRRTHCKAWTIQVGAYRKKNLAASAAERFLKSKLPAYLNITFDERGPLFVVQIGRYPTYEQAAAELPVVRSQQAEAFIIPSH